MTVGELIDQLGSYPDRCQVVCEWTPTIHGIESTYLLSKGVEMIPWLVMLVIDGGEDE